VSAPFVVLIVWTLVAFVALALARTLCAAAARADAEQAEQRVRRPVEAPRYTQDSTSADPRRHGGTPVAPRSRGRILARR
jgi:hypothetical protein